MKQLLIITTNFMNKFGCILLLIFVYSCMDSFEELDIGVETLTYTGNNEMGKILFSKLQQNDIDDKFLELQKCSEILLDYTELSCTEKYGYIFSAPLKNKKTGIIESYLIFRTVNEADINPNNTKLDQSILIDQDFLNNLNGCVILLTSGIMENCILNMKELILLKIWKNIHIKYI